MACVRRLSSYGGTDQQRYSDRPRALPGVQHPSTSSLPTGARCTRIPAARQCGYVGWISATVPAANEGGGLRRSAADRRPRRPPDRADAAEVVVPAGQRRTARPCALERGQPRSSTPGSALTSVAAGWKRGRSIAACGSTPSCRTAPSTPTSAVRSRVPPAAPSASSRLGRRRRRASGPSCSPSARRAERLADEVGLAEHAVQVQVEPGQPVARAETEARRQHARVARRRRRR